MISSGLSNEYEIMNISGTPQSQNKFVSWELKENKKCKLHTLPLTTCITNVYLWQTLLFFNPGKRRKAKAYFTGDKIYISAMLSIVEKWGICQMKVSKARKLYPSFANIL